MYIGWACEYQHVVWSYYYYNSMDQVKNTSWFLKINDRMMLQLSDC